MSYKYKATKKGLLSNPYKLVKAGDLVILPEPIKASWLTPIDEYVEEAPLPLTATSDAQIVSPAPQVNVPPVATTEGYATGIADIQAAEAAQDAAAAPAAPAPQAAPVTAPAPAEPQTGSAEQKANTEAPQVGTGEQNVI